MRIRPKWLKQAARFGFHNLGGPNILRLWQQKGVRILGYHRFNRACLPIFERQCRYLRSHYRPVSLAEAVDSLHDRDGSTSPRQIVLTVDDGHKDFYLHAYPILSSYRIPATVFLVTDFIDQKGWLWWDAMAYALTHADKAQGSLEIALSSSELLRLPLNSPENRISSTKTIGQKLLKVSNRERLKVLAEIPRLLNLTVPSLPTEGFAPLSWDEIRLMAADGIEFGAHTKTHPILSRIVDCEEAHEEIKESKVRIEEELGREVTQFCYPNGGPEDFSAETVEIVRRCGFRSAVTLGRRLNLPGANPLCLDRIGVVPDCSDWYYRERVDALWRIVEF